MTVFGRQVRDGLPILPGKYNPHNTWQELLHHRELAMAKRHVSHHEAWSEHTKKLAELQKGDKVFIQNQVGPNPRKWERTGTVVECKDHDQYTVKVDGTGRLTLRNRKFLRKLKLMPKPSPSPTSDPVVTTLPTREPETGTQSDVVQGTELPTDYTTSSMPATQQPDLHTLHSPVATHSYPSPEPVHPAPQPAVQFTPATPVHSVTRPTSTSASPTMPSPAITARPSSPAPVTRPQRTRRPNTLFNPGTWDLSGLEEDSPTLTRKEVSDLFLHIAQMLDKGL